MLVIALICNALASRAQAGCPPDSSHRTGGRGTAGTSDQLRYRPLGGLPAYRGRRNSEGSAAFLEKEPGSPVEDRLDASQLRSLLAQFDRAYDQVAAVNSGPSGFVFHVSRGKRRLQWTGMPQPTDVAQLQKTLVELFERLDGNGSSDK